MSYIVLSVSNDGAVCASDSRLSVDALFLKFKIDRMSKTYYSKNNKMVWAICGVSTRGFRNFLAEAARILEKDELPLEKRLEKFEKFICRQTRFEKKLTRQESISELIYACYEDRNHPVIGKITVYSGKVVRNDRYQAPCIMEAGANCSKLAPLEALRPDINDTVGDMADVLRKRVRESINKDIELHGLDPKYRMTVGGKIQVKQLHVKRTETGNEEA